MAEQKNKKVEEQIDNTPIDGQMEIAPEDTAELKVVEETADTVKLEMPDGEQVDVEKTELEMPEETTSCADHISRTKVLDVINSTMAKYESKVVLAMSEVRDIIKAITTAVNE
jgi:hypothetical protein